MNLGSRGPVVIDTGVFGARLAPEWAVTRRAVSAGAWRPAGSDLFCHRCRAWVRSQAGRLGPGTGSGGWSTRLAVPRSSGLGRISPT